MGLHKHHIIPKHLGGSNHPDNLVEVTIKEHAEIHRCLWIYGGRWQDEVAWRMLSGQISSDKARRLAVSRALKGTPKSLDHRNKMSKKIPWIKGKAKENYPQLSNSGVKKGSTRRGRMILTGDERTDKQKAASAKHSEYWAKRRKCDKYSKNRKNGQRTY